MATTKKTAKKATSKKAAKKSAKKTAKKAAKTTKKAASKTAAKTTKKKVTSKKAAKTAAKTTKKKPTTKKPAAKKSTTKKAAPPKTESKKKVTSKKPAAKAAPKKPTAKKPAAKKPFAKKAVAKKAVAKKLEAAPVAKKVPAKPTPLAKLDFKINQHIVYPAHGVGKIIDVESQEVAGTDIELFVVDFDKDKMTLRVPTAKATAVGMRSLSSTDTVKNALKTLKGRARIKRTMWSRRAQEYEAKINSGDLISIAEVVRDLHRAGGQPEQSYSERQLYEAALDRMAREVGAVEKLKDEDAIARLEDTLAKGATAHAAAAAAAAEAAAAEAAENGETPPEAAA